MALPVSWLCHSDIIPVSKIGEVVILTDPEPLLGETEPLVHLYVTPAHEHLSGWVRGEVHSEEATVTTITLPQNGQITRTGVAWITWKYTVDWERYARADRGGYLVFRPVSKVRRGDVVFFRGGYHRIIDLESSPKEWCVTMAGMGELGDPTMARLRKGAKLAVYRQQP